MANDPVSDALASAKGALAHANAAFPPAAKPAAKPAAAPAAPAKAPSLSDELKAKKTMVDKARTALPQMHEGGPVAADGGYELKAGEHVLTAAQAKMVRKHALMAVGMHSLAKPAMANSAVPKSAPNQAQSSPKEAKKSTSGVTVRPAKTQPAKSAGKKK
jgi:hypothetical protein